MVIHSIVDSTQQAICPMIGVTEYMIAQAVHDLSGSKSKCDIVALEDLGFSNNVFRMLGGFFTGMFIEWDPDISFVPVDATINACGVSVYECQEISSFEQFEKRVRKAEKDLDALGIKNNFNIGNHFISYSRDEFGRSYLIIHASDNSYKYGEKGLYPEPGCWYWKDLKVKMFQNRYLRYLCGETAKTFYEFYLQAEENNPKRNDLMAGLILGENNCDKVLYSQHYGMPTSSSIAIGCQWRQGDKMLLTRRGQPIFVIDDYNQRFNLFPHGLGVRLNGELESLQLEEEQMLINSISVDSHVKMLESGLVENRFLEHKINDEFLKSFLKNRQFKVKKQLTQIYSYSRFGIDKFDI